jgi:hypothetical protein
VRPWRARGDRDVNVFLDLARDGGVGLVDPVGGAESEPDVLNFFCAGLGVEVNRNQLGRGGVGLVADHVVNLDFQFLELEQGVRRS